MKVIFMGTPDFAVATLEEIINAGHDVAAVVTQPDKAKGRGKAFSMPPVKETAIKHNIEVLQPIKVREREVLDKLRTYNADVIVVVAFGQILPRELLDMPKYGCVNVHASLLPKYRGAAPIQWAVIDGEKESGVTTMQMADGIDTGDILMVEKYTLAKDETGGSLFDRLSVIGAKLLVKTIEGLENGTVKPIPQTGEATHAAKLDKSTGRIDFTKDADEIERLVRGLNPWPSAFTFLNGKMLKIWSVQVEETACLEAGIVYLTDGEGIHIATGKGGIVIKELQLEGKKRMDSQAFLRGCNIDTGTKLGME